MSLRRVRYYPVPTQIGGIGINGGKKVDNRTAYCWMVGFGLGGGKERVVDYKEGAVLFY